MIWNDGAAGLPLTMEALSCIAREAEELASLCETMLNKADTSLHV